MKRIFLLDTYYPSFLESLPRPITGTYETELRKVLDRGFGTADFFSHYLEAEGWTCADAIANYELLQGQWAMEHRGWSSGSLKAIALEQIAEFKPDVLFLQDLGFFNAAELSHLSKTCMIAAQCSCAIHPGKYSDISVIFTSLPNHVERFRALGVPTVEYLPLAFDPRMLSEESPKKQFDISFVGGVGRNSHWRAGTDVLEAVAKAFPDQCHFFVYGRDNLAKDSPLHGVCAPAVWGREMYSVYGRSKIVINRHGEVAEGYANNLRMYEAAGSGALLVTEYAPNIRDLFPLGSFATYNSIDDLIFKLRWNLDNPKHLQVTAANGQSHVLSNHTYAHRMKVVSEVLTHALEKVVA